MLLVHHHDGLLPFFLTLHVGPWFSKSKALFAFVSQHCELDLGPVCFMGLFNSLGLFGAKSLCGAKE